MLASFCFYKRVQVLRSRKFLSQINVGIEKWDNLYYKVGHVLQSGTTLLNIRAYITRYKNDSLIGHNYPQHEIIPVTITLLSFLDRSARQF